MVRRAVIVSFLFLWVGIEGEGGCFFFSAGKAGEIAPLDETFTPQGYILLSPSEAVVRISKEEGVRIHLEVRYLRGEDENSDVWLRNNKSQLKPPRGWRRLFYTPEDRRLKLLLHESVFTDDLPKTASVKEGDPLHIYGRGFRLKDGTPIVVVDAISRKALPISSEKGSEATPPSYEKIRLRSLLDQIAFKEGKRVETLLVYRGLMPLGEAWVRTLSGISPEKGRQFQREGTDLDERLGVVLPDEGEERFSALREAEPGDTVIVRGRVMAVDHHRFVLLVEGIELPPLP